MRATNLLAAGLSVSLLIAPLVGCAGPAKTAPPVNAAPAPSALSGKVVETMDAGGYTYICLEKGGTKTWVAAPIMKVAVGDEVQLYPGMEMNDFTSKALNRTFEKIIFSGGPIQNPAAQSAAPADSAHTKPGQPSKASTPEKPITAGKVVETMNAGSYTYICLEKDGKRGWAAVPATQVSIGDEIEIKPGVEMGKFTSKTLNRTFDNIIFSAGIVPKK